MRELPELEYIEEFNQSPVFAYLVEDLKDKLREEMEKFKTIEKDEFEAQKGLTRGLEYGITLLEGLRAKRVNRDQYLERSANRR